MIYVMSDIHDHYSRYRSVMKQIRLRKNDNCTRFMPRFLFRR